MNIAQTNTGTGGLMINVYNTSVAVPLSNAEITITNPENNTSITVTTDISGQTDIVYLPCPPIEYSLSPDMPKPFAQYNLYVNADRFISAEVEGVQIFSDIIAIQNITLLPAVTNEPDEFIEIQYPTLWGDFPEKIPESEEKPLPPETGYIVLDYPVIPEYIVVHDGSPNDNSAPNYYIEFKDYIKNVASCEIYSTWPDAAIRANVLAIISFTLNRVFTEWYRNQGKNFTITSSTAYVIKWNIFTKIKRLPSK